MVQKKETDTWGPPVGGPQVSVFYMHQENLPSSVSRENAEYINRNEVRC